MERCSYGRALSELKISFSRDALLIRIRHCRIHVGHERERS